jgi:DNA-damage-inducible protein J
MAVGKLVQARINGDIKDEATAVLASMGLTVAVAIRIFLTRVACDPNFPLERVLSINFPPVSNLQNKNT